MVVFIIGGSGEIQKWNEIKDQPDAERGKAEGGTTQAVLSYILIIMLLLFVFEIQIGKIQYIIKKIGIKIKKKKIFDNIKSMLF